MPTNIIPRHRGPQSDDGPTALLAKLLAAQAQRVTGTALALGSRTSTTQSSLIDCTGFRAIVIYFRVTAAPGTDTVRISLRGVDPVSAQTILLAQGPTVAAASEAAYSFGPGCGTAMALPDQIRIMVSHSPSPSGSFDYSVGYCMIP